MMRRTVGMSANIIECYRRADINSNRCAAGNWYRTATRDRIAHGRTETRVPVQGVICRTVRPQKAWSYQTSSSRKEAFFNNEARGGHVQDAVDKAERIMLGEDPLNVLPEDSKTWNFFPVHCRSGGC